MTPTHDALRQPVGDTVADRCPLTDVDSFCITNPTAHRLTVALARLRAEQRHITAANRTLVEYGLTTGSPEIHARLRAIQAEALAIATRLDTLGAHDPDAAALILTAGAAR
ncbi:hypothetical protein [Dactylosporangium sp. CA-139066]|uniref:hypothetical protein n=1 Tax=Dactylosporangium sp. CA-139066 TaxID=3239930 RepID=UPI003D8B407B